MPPLYVCLCPVNVIFRSFHLGYSYEGVPELKGELVQPLKHLLSQLVLSQRHRNFFFFFQGDHTNVKFNVNKALFYDIQVMVLANK